MEGAGKLDLEVLMPANEKWAERVKPLNRHHNLAHPS